MKRAQRAGGLAVGTVVGLGGVIVVGLPAAALADVPDAASRVVLMQVVLFELVAP